MISSDCTNVNTATESLTWVSCRPFSFAQWEKSMEVLLWITKIHLKSYLKALIWMLITGNTKRWIRLTSENRKDEKSSNVIEVNP